MLIGSESMPVQSHEAKLVLQCAACGFFFILDVLSAIRNTPPQAVTACFKKLTMKNLIKKDKIASLHFQKKNSPEMVLVFFFFSIFKL